MFCFDFCLVFAVLTACSVIFVCVWLLSAFVALLGFLSVLLAGFGCSFALCWFVVVSLLLLFLIVLLDLFVVVALLDICLVGCYVGFLLGFCWMVCFVVVCLRLVGCLVDLLWIFLC